MPFQIIKSDITKVKADAIVNTANPHVAVGDGVDSAIYEAAGYEKLLEERRKIGELRPGEVGVTPAFALQAKCIIHVSGPVWNGGEKGEPEILRSCYDQALKLAYRRGCNSIAFPLISTGAYGFPKELGLQIAIDAFTAFLEEHEMEITLVVYGIGAVHVSGDLAYEGKNSDEACERIGELIRRQRTGQSLSLDAILKGIYTESFGKHLQSLIKQKGLKNASVYAAANISKQYFSKLLKDQVKPSKGKVMSLAVGLRLNLDETTEFLRFAGYALSPISQTDQVVKYFIKNEDYNVIKINIVLFDYGLSPLSE
jgi:O-acetyl-ADP-ribose deacetylase (regulator of RNase III)/transcriptional regulator with XRE-family HTH domain